MASLIQIANQALLRVGEEPITALTDNSEQAIAVNASWPFVRPEVLRAHSWNCATERALLPALVAAPDWGFATAYQLPADCLWVVEANTTADWRIEGRHLLADTTGQLGIRYVKDETDTSQYDGLLAQVMVLRLAAEVVERLTNSRTKRESLLLEYEDKLMEARGVDGEEGSPAEMEESDWITVRY